MRITTFIFIFSFLAGFTVRAQKALQITTEHFGKVKIYEMVPNDAFNYKLKGKLFYKKDQLVNVQDSLVMLTNANAVSFKDLRSIRYNKDRPLAYIFRKVFIIGGSDCSRWLPPIMQSLIISPL